MCIIIVLVLALVRTCPESLDVGTDLVWLLQMFEFTCKQNKSVHQTLLKKKGKGLIELNIHVQDFEGCITTLHQLGYSQPACTALHGVSAGGLLVAAVCNRAPHLVQAAILEGLHHGS